MKARVLVFLIGFGLAASVKAKAQPPSYLPNAQSCVSRKTTNGGGKHFYNNCSTKIYVSVYTDEGLIFDGYYKWWTFGRYPGKRGFALQVARLPGQRDSGQQSNNGRSGLQHD